QRRPAPCAEDRAPRTAPATRPGLRRPRRPRYDVEAVASCLRENSRSCDAFVVCSRMFRHVEFDEPAAEDRFGLSDNAWRDAHRRCTKRVDGDFRRRELGGVADIPFLELTRTRFQVKLQGQRVTPERERLVLVVVVEGKTAGANGKIERIP